jgi:hypothetical protein
MFVPAGSSKPGICSVFAQFFHSKSAAFAKAALELRGGNHVQDHNRHNYARPRAPHTALDLR